MALIGSHSPYESKRVAREYKTGQDRDMMVETGVWVTQLLALKMAGKTRTERNTGGPWRLRKVRDRPSLESPEEPVLGVSSVKLDFQTSGLQSIK